MLVVKGIFGGPDFCPSFAKISGTKSGEPFSPPPAFLHLPISTASARPLKFGPGFSPYPCENPVLSPVEA